MIKNKWSRPFDKNKMGLWFSRSNIIISVVFSPDPSGVYICVDCQRAVPSPIFQGLATEQTLRDGHGERCRNLASQRGQGGRVGTVFGDLWTGAKNLGKPKKMVQNGGFNAFYFNHRKGIVIDDDPQWQAQFSDAFKGVKKKTSLSWIHVDTLNMNKKHIIVACLTVLIVDHLVD